MKLHPTMFGVAGSKQRILSGLAIFTVCVAALVSFKVLQVRAEVKPGQYPKEKVARQNFATVDGRRFNLQGMRGKVVVLQFFGTWCGYSKRQVPAINQLRGNGNPEDLEVIGMAVKDPRSNAQAVKQFITEQRVTYPIVGEVDDKYFVDFVNSTDVSVPQTLVYGRDGRLLAHYKGFNAQVGTEVEAKVKAELALKQ